MFLFKTPEYRRFNLQPRFWDPKKEEREARERRIKAELGIKDKDGQYIPNVKGQLRQEFNKRRSTRSGISFGSSTLRFFMILIMLFIAAFYVFIKNPEGILRFFGL